VRARAGGYRRATLDERAEDSERAGPEYSGGALAPTPSRALHRGAPLLLALLALLTWAGVAVRGGFAYDDREVLFDNPVVAGDLPLWSVFDRDYWHHIGDAGHWRPLATLSLRLDHHVHGADSHGYHATNVALHALAVALAALVALRAARALGAAFPWFGLALFAVHPLLADSVAWISGRTSMLTALGGLVGALGVGAAASASRPHAVRFPAWGQSAWAQALVVTCAAFGGVALALMGKEDGLVFVVVLPLVALAHAPREARVRLVGATLAGSALAVGAWLAARSASLGSALPSAPHALLADEPLPVRLAHGLAAWGEGLAATFVPLLAMPPNLTVDDVGGAHLAGRVALFAALCAVALGLGWRGQARAMRISERADDGPRDRAVQGRAHWGHVHFVQGSAACVLAAIAPHLQLVPSGELFAPRFLYLPLLLGAPALSAALRALVPRDGPRVLVATGALALCVSLAQAHAARYASREAFWEAHLPRHKTDPRVWNELGNAAREVGDLAAAEAAFTRATELAPDYSRAWVNLGTLALERGDLDAARAHLARAVERGRDNPVAHANLGNVLTRLGLHAEAAAAYRRAVELAPGRAAFQRGLARTLARSGDLDGARAAVREALAQAPQDAASRALARELGLE
jgi:tetratricopeptide (TPR) repeat protein